MLCFEKQGGSPVIEAYTYLYYTQLKGSQPSAQHLGAVRRRARSRSAIADFKRLWGTNFLDDLVIEVHDVRYANGVPGKVVVYSMEERQRVKIVDYVGPKKVDQTKIEEVLKEKNITIKLDSFIDPGLIRKVSGVVRDVYAEKGYQFVEVKPEIKPVEGGTKIVNVTFHITEGPKVKIRDVDFVGNSAVSDGKLSKQLKENKGPGMFSFVLGSGTYKEEKFEEDADRVVEYYRDRGYIGVRVGQPDLKILEDSRDQKTRWVQLRIPITEGKRYRVGKIDFEGNKVVTGEALRPLFKLADGDVYSEKVIRKGFEKAKEVYGGGGYMEFTGYPDLKPRDLPEMTNGAGAAAGPSPAPAPAPAPDGPPIVDVTLRIQEGKQYFVNRITFVGNTTTRDPVIRREVRLLESGIFNTEALKFSVKRLNQLGYFKPLEGEAISVDKTPGADNKVDVKLKFEEQNRNQLTFGAGVSQYDGFFGQLSFQTSNFLGRGETFTVSAQQGSRATNYQLAFSEPFLFNRPQTAGVDLFIRELEYIGLYTQKSRGGNLVYGFQVQDFARMFINYSYEHIRVEDLNPAFFDPAGAGRQPAARRLAAHRRRRQAHDQQDRPELRLQHRRPSDLPDGRPALHALDRLRGHRGQHQLHQPAGRSHRLHPAHAGGRRSASGRRASTSSRLPAPRCCRSSTRSSSAASTASAASTSGRVSPRDPFSGVQIGGNKSLLFNGEYLINIAGPVRLVLFFDAGQVRDIGDTFAWKEPIKEQFRQGELVPPIFVDSGVLRNPLSGVVRPIETRTVGEAYAFKTSTGAEIRFFMPVLNVPFRLIFAMNPSRENVLDNNLQPEKKYKFRFAVGSTF